MPMDPLHFINITRTFRLQFPLIYHIKWDLALIIQWNQDNAAQRVMCLFLIIWGEPITLQFKYGKCGFWATYPEWRPWFERFESSRNFHKPHAEVPIWQLMRQGPATKLVPQIKGESFSWIEIDMTQKCKHWMDPNLLWKKDDAWKEKTGEAIKSIRQTPT